ncbi:hypothetical protein FB639_004876, partial [Coemansia asiatica]
MPSPSLLSHDDRSTILNIQPKPKFSVLGAAVARLFVAHPDTRKWTYTRRFGALVLVKDTHNNDASFLRIVNLGSSGQPVLWEQELYRGFELVRQTPFFFTVAGDKYIFGLDFADVDEAAKFEEKVKKRARKIMKQNAAAAAAAVAIASSGPSATQRTLNLDDDKYRKLVKALAAYNITENMLDDPSTAKLIKDFVNQNGSVDNLIRSVHPKAPSQAPPPPPPPPPTNAPPPPPQSAPLRSPVPGAQTASALPAKSPVMRTASPHQAPPPPPPPVRRNVPPPPPPRHRPPPPQQKSTPSTPQQPHASLPPPPPPPRNARKSSPPLSAAPPPPPRRHANASSPVPLSQPDSYVPSAPPAPPTLPQTAPP